MRWPEQANLVADRAGWRSLNACFGSIFGFKTAVGLLRARVPSRRSQPIFILLTPASTRNDLEGRGTVLRHSKNGPKKSQKVSAEKYRYTQYIGNYIFSKYLFVMKGLHFCIKLRDRTIPAHFLRISLPIASGLTHASL
jgi:hypothetical protein